MLATSSGAFACGDDDDNGGGDGPKGDNTQVACTVGAKTVELIGQGLRRGNGFREIIDDVGGGLDKACEAAVKIFVLKPGTAVELTITDSAGSLPTAQVDGITLEEPAQPSDTSSPCDYYTSHYLWLLCFEQELEALERSIGP